jgi:hypothetical protein
MYELTGLKYLSLEEGRKLAQQQNKGNEDIITYDNGEEPERIIDKNPTMEDIKNIKPPTGDV